MIKTNSTKTKLKFHPTIKYPEDNTIQSVHVHVWTSQQKPKEVTTVFTLKEKKAK